MKAYCSALKEKMLELTRLFCIENNIFQRFVIVYKYITLIDKDPVTKEVLQGIFDNTVKAMGYKDLPKYEEINSNFRIHRVKCLRSKKEICHPWEQATYLISAWFKCNELIKKEKYDICHCHFIIPTGVLALRLKKKFNLDYVITSHGSDVPGHNTDRFKLLHKFTGPILRTICKMAKAITVPSHFLKDLILRNIDHDINEKMIVLPNGSKDFTKKDIEKENIILSVGRMHEGKGFQYLMEAFKKIDSDDWKLYLVGDGPYKKTLEKMAEGNKRNVKKLDFMYSGTFTCGFCGCAITAERKKKYILGTNEVKTYHYYHCTHKRKETGCREGSIQEDELERQVKSDLKKLEMHPQFLSLALDYLEKNKTEEIETEKPVKLDIEKKVKDLEDQLSELNSMRMKKMLDDADYLVERTKLKAEIEALSQNEIKTKPSKAELIELTKENFIFCAQARKEFDKGDKETRNNIIKKLGSNQRIIGKNISISYHNWLIPLRNNVEKFNAEIARFEPTYFSENKRKSEALTSLNLRWLPPWDSNRSRS